MGRGGRGRIRGEPRTSSLVVLAAFGLGIGPGTAVQPCPRHPPSSTEKAIDTGAPATRVVHHAHAVHADPGSAPPSSHARGGGATDERHGEAPGTSHPDGPCDCLGLCHANYAPQTSFAAARAFDAGPIVARRAPEPVQLVARHPARHLRPFAQPPPA